MKNNKKYTFSYESLKKLEQKVCDIIGSNISEKKEIKRLLTIEEVCKKNGITANTVRRNILKYKTHREVYRIGRQIRLKI